ncbi:MAG: hypothetical protein SGJ20_01470 [Planctomycetota bacterium]|nr:hypothetical protein [Planctomycetota bacterium]
MSNLTGAQMPEFATDTINPQSVHFGVVEDGIPPMPQLGYFATTTSSKTNVNGKLSISGSTERGPKKSFQYGFGLAAIRVGDVIPLMGDIYRVKEASDDFGVFCERLKKEGKLESLWPKSHIVAPLSRDDGPSGCGLFGTSIGVQEISDTGKDKAKTAKVKIVHAKEQSELPPEKWNTILTVKVGDLIPVDDSKQFFRVEKIVPRDDKKQIYGWIELSAEPVKPDAKKSDTKKPAPAATESKPKQ